MDLWQYERQARDEGWTAICGCDEAGAGPLAGPVYAAAVILPLGHEIPGLNDSKKLSEKKREELFPAIQTQALAWSVASVGPEEIDAADIALIDGNRDKGRSAAIATPHQCVIKGDSLSASIAAASILAKVSRDRYMVEMAKRYPQYAFEQHKGYGTRLHYERLAQYGPSPIHRLTFLKP